MIDLIQIFKDALKPSEKKPIAEWAEDNIYLSVRQATGFPGYYRSEITPYVRGIFDALQDPAIRKVTVEKGAQTGLTLCGYIWLCYTMAEDAGPILLVYPSADLARSASETRFMPMVEDSPKLREFIPDDKDEWTKLQQRTKKCTVNWVGSNSPANLASRPIRLLFLDEVDKYPIDNQREGNAISLAEQRTKTFWNRKIFKISTPTTEQGAIHVDFLSGDQRRFYIPCPHCHIMQFLKWPQVKWPEGKPHEAKYHCEACGKAWSETDRNIAVSRGEWRATAVSKDPSHVSFHLSSMYSPWTKLADLATRFMRCKAFVNELQDFVNSELGEPFIHFDNSIRDTVFSELEGHYRENDNWINIEPYKQLHTGKRSFIFGGVDVQKGYLVAAFRSFVEGGDSALVWAGEVPNFTTLESIASKIGAELTLIDSRYRTQEVNEFCLTYKGYIPAQGITRKGVKVCYTEQFNPDEGKSLAKAGRVLVCAKHYGDDVKAMLADMIQRNKGARVWLVPQGYASRLDYCEQMTAEKSVNGKWMPIPAGRPNHYWDAECLCLVGAILTETYKAAEVVEEN